MTDRDRSHQLSPLDRLHLREQLQDRWRDEVRRITELSVDLHTAFDGDVLRPDAVGLAEAITRSRLHLVDIEDAMHRLDDRSYGTCAACDVTLSMEWLAERPEARHCEQCRTAAGAPRRDLVPAIA